MKDINLRSERFLNIKFKHLNFQTLKFIDLRSTSFTHKIIYDFSIIKCFKNSINFFISYNSERERREYIHCMH